MSSSQELYNHLDKKLRELVHVRNGKQVTNWIWIIVGILQSRTLNLVKLRTICRWIPKRSQE